MKNLPLYDVRPINNLKEMLDTSTELYGSKTAFLVKRASSEIYQPISYVEFKNDVNAFGTALCNIGLKGKRIALIGESRYEWDVSYLSTLNGTGISVPLDKELPSNELENLLARSNANAVVFSSCNKEQILNISKRLTSLEYYIDMDASENYDNVLSFSLLLEEGKKLLEKGDTSFVNAEIDNEVMSILLFTSGTTETSKAVMLSHRNVSSNLMAMCSMLYIDPSDIFLSILPIHHTYECTCGFLCPLYRGAAIAHSEGLRHIPKNLQESKATVLLGVPLIFEAIYKRIWDQVAKRPGMKKKVRLALAISNLLRKLNVDITKKVFKPIHSNLGGNLKILISGAAGIEPSVAKGFREFGFLFVQGYGLTECSPIVALNRDLDFKDDAAGIPLPNLTVRIVNPSQDGVGEIVVNGPSIMLGYYENPEATEKAIKDGWLYTGDLGYIDNDSFVHITGRKKNVIVTKNGKNIYPEEIEALLSRIPYVKESLIYGKADEIIGDTVVSAIIVPNMEKLQEDFKDNSLSPEAIFNMLQSEIKELNKSLITYKRIKDFQLREVEFAKTTTKKIKRYMENKL